MTHYIAMAGMHGCIPNTCHVHESYSEAVESLALMHDLGRERAHMLKRDSYLELSLRRDGNEYAEIVECKCATPKVHND